MAFTHIATVGNAGDAAGGTLDASATLNVQAGDVLVGWAKVEGLGAANIGFDEDSGGESFNMEVSTLGTNNDALRGQFGWRVAASSNATFRPRMTCESSHDFRRMIVHQFRPDPGDTVSFVVGSAGIGDGTSIASGNVSPTGDDLIAVGGFGEFTNTTTTSEQINGVAATEPSGSPQASNTSSWYRILSSGFTDGQATATTGSSAAWVCSIIVLKAEAGSEPNDYEIEAEQGSYSLTGQDVTLTYLKGIRAEQGSYTLSGQDVDLVYVGSGELLDAAQGSYTLTGQDVNFSVTRRLAAEFGTYNLTGETALVDIAMFAETGSYTLTGQTVDLITADDALTAEVGTYSLTGQSVILAKGTIMAGDQGSYSLTGQDVTFKHTYVVAANPGFYSWVGFNTSDHTAEGGVSIPREPGLSPSEGENISGVSRGRGLSRGQ
jgi:hypothetical protein